MTATSNRIRSAVISALKADEILTTPRGWTANLAIFRIVFLSSVAMRWALEFLSWTERILPGIPRGMWLPVSFYRLLPIGLLGNVAVARVLGVADVVLIVLGIVGFCTRWSIGLATLVSLYGFGLMENFGKIDHYHHVIWFMALLAAGPSGDFFSIDALRQAIKNADEGNVELSFPSSSALWALRYTWLMMGALYLGTGIAKLQSSLTNHWASAASLRNIMWRKWLELYWYDPHVGRLIRADSLPAWILAILGASVVAFEVGFIFAVLFRKVRPALALWGLAFHVGNGLVLKIWFWDLMPAYVCLFDWIGMSRALFLRGRNPLLVFYDEGCGFCRRTVAILRSLDLFDALKPVAGLSKDPVRGSYPQLTEEMLTRDVYAASRGQIAAGYDAYVWIAKRLFVLWPIAALLRFPLVAALGKRTYRRIADSRHCPLATAKGNERLPILRPPFTLIHRVGVLLFACQLGVSSFMLLYSLRYVYLSTNVPLLRTARWLVNGIGKRQPVWPFDLYPTFTSANPSDTHIQVWEARWVTSEGREIRVSPNAYYGLFGNSGLTWNITSDEMLRGGDSEQNQARSLNLVRSLWKYELTDIQRNVTAVNIYRVEYRLQPPSDRFPAAVVAQSILYTFPLAKIMGNSIPFSAFKEMGHTAAPKGVDANASDAQTL
jgi:predicted DCC family thiol-disulfide oxidoreductase YuxK